MSNKEEIPWTWGDGGQPPPPPPEAKEGQRFLACGYDAEMKPFADGNWISYNDYSKLLHERIHDIQQIGGLQEENARLRSEVERLDTLCKQVMAQHSDISCENIMLRKANDELAEVRELHAGFNRALFNETVTENARLKAEVDAIRKELAEAQENYHLVNEMVAKMLKAGKSIE
jgi:regulator of replication initiation timing